MAVEGLEDVWHQRCMDAVSERDEALDGRAAWYAAHGALAAQLTRVRQMVNRWRVEHPGEAVDLTDDLLALLGSGQRP